MLDWLILSFYGKTEGHQTPISAIGNITKTLSSIRNRNPEYILLN